MIVGIGTDIVEIERFKDWHLKPKNRLRRIFSVFEIEYCLSHNSKAAERLAVRFAAKEAGYKAATQALGAPPCPFLTWCQLCELKNPFGELQILFNFGYNVRIHCSVSHSQNHALAFVIIELLDSAIGIDKSIK